MTVTLVDALVLFGGFQGLILSAYLALHVEKSASPRRTAQRMVALIVAILGMDMIFLVIHSTDLVLRFSSLLFVTDPLYTLIGPITLLFISILTIPSYRIRPLTLLIFVPSLAELVSYGFSLTLPHAVKVERLTHWSTGGTFAEAYAFFWGAELLFNVVLVAAAAVRLQAFRRRQKSSESDGGALRYRAVTWVLVTIGSFFALQIAVLLRYVLQRPPLSSLFTVMYAVLGLCFFVIVYATVFRRNIPMGLFGVAPPAPAAKYERSALDSGQLERYAERIDATMRENALFLRNDLRLSSLAEETALPPNHVSQVINQVRGKNFFDYVNGFRVEEAKRLMADPNHRHWKLLSIGHAAGFSSKSTFNKVFKETTGSTPSAYFHVVAQDQHEHGR